MTGSAGGTVNPCGITGVSACSGLWVGMPGSGRGRDARYHGVQAMEAKHAGGGTRVQPRTLTEIISIHVSLAGATKQPRRTERAFDGIQNVLLGIHRNHIPRYEVPCRVTISVTQARCNSGDTGVVDFLFQDDASRTRPPPAFPDLVTRGNRTLRWTSLALRPAISMAIHAISRPYVARREYGCALPRTLCHRSDASMLVAVQRAHANTPQQYHGEAEG